MSRKYAQLFVMIDSAKRITTAERGVSRKYFSVYSCLFLSQKSLCVCLGVNVLEQKGFCTPKLFKRVVLKQRIALCETSCHHNGTRLSTGKFSRFSSHYTRVCVKKLSLSVCMSYRFALPIPTGKANSTVQSFTLFCSGPVLSSQKRFSAQSPLCVRTDVRNPHD